MVDTSGRTPVMNSELPEFELTIDVAERVILMLLSYIYDFSVDV